MALSWPVTTMPERIQRKRSEGWRLPAGAVCVDRTSRFGNPFREIDAAARELEDPRRACVTSYTEWINGDTAYGDVYIVHRRCFDRRWVRANLDLLAGRDLACWCLLPADGEPDVCHGAVLLSLANRQAGNDWCDDCDSNDCSCAEASVRAIEDVPTGGVL